MNTRQPDESQRRLQAIERVLLSGPRSAQELMGALAISQPTLSRTIQSNPEKLTFFRTAGDRTPKYALLRTLPLGLNARQTVYRISTTGHIDTFAKLEILSGGATFERRLSHNTLYEGLPPYMTFAAPSGFLGRQVAHAAALDMNFPQSLKDWGDDHRLTYLFTRGLNLSGNLVYGDVALQLEMDFRNAPALTSTEKLARYAATADQLKDTAYGSSAGGEQPKFLSLTEDVGHVIVKFAKAGTRMADLLPLEHLALHALTLVGVPAAKSRLLAAGGYVFLEVERFDRVGRNGRIGMLSAGSIDDEWFGSRDSWSEFATRCEQAKLLSRGCVRHIDVMAAFSELIGNTDRHFENISILLPGDGGQAHVAPAYDILPMKYASIGGGVDPDLTPVVPRVGAIGAKPEVWATAATAAAWYWDAVRDAVRHPRLGAPVSKAFGELAVQNQAIVADFVAPLIPVG